MAKHKTWTQRISEIRGRNDGNASFDTDVDTLLQYIDLLHTALDDADSSDSFGTEGWKHSILHED